MQVSNSENALSESDQYNEKRSESSDNTTKWIEDAIIYELIPDRFAYSWRNSDGSEEDSDDKHLVKKKTESEPIPGTMKGIIDNVDYILKLGVNCICLNPFKFDENGKNAYDYYHISKQLGKDKDFAFLVKFCHDCHISVIMDGLYHEYDGENRAEHRKEHNNEEINNEETKNEERMIYYLELCHQWIIEYGIDGVKIDITVDTNMETLLMFCDAVKKCDEKCVILVNNYSQNKFNEDENKEADQGLDIVYNEKFHIMCKDFFALNHINVDEFRNQFNPPELECMSGISYPFINFLSDKRIPRFLFLCNNDLSRYKLSILYLMTSPGIPMILYGDENPVFGEKEKDSLQTMSFDEEHELFTFYKAAIFVRKKLKGLRVGGYRTVAAEKGGNLLVYERYTEDECITIALNAGESEVPLDLDTEGKIIIWNNGFGNLKLSPFGFVIVREKRAN